MSQERGFDAGKKINGRKRHLVVDTLGLVVMAYVHKASIQDRDGAKTVIDYALLWCASISLIWADGGYAGKLEDWIIDKWDRLLKVIKRNEQVKGFQLLPRR